MELDLLNLLLVLLTAWLAGFAASRLGYPSVLGELLGGVILGPPLLGIIEPSAALGVLAEIGILLMMLYIGMEVNPRELRRSSWYGSVAAVGGFIVPFGLVYAAALLLGSGHDAGVLLGIAAGVTSLATNSRVVSDLDLLDTRIANIIMTGALVADVLSLALFSVLTAVMETGRVDVVATGLVVLRMALFLGAAAVVGVELFPRMGRRLSDAGLTGRTFQFTLVLIIAVLFGELAEVAGLHAILGAFIAGLFMRDEVLGASLARELMRTVRHASLGFLAPIFFVTVGFSVSFEVFRTDLLLFLTVLLLAVAGKVLGTALFYRFTGQGWREGLVLGASMNGRGGVEIIIGGIALEAGLISGQVFSILVFMAIVATVLAPLLLRRGVGWLARRGELVRIRGERDGIVIVGAGPVACELAKVLARSAPVCLVDSSEERCARARGEGLRAVAGNALQEQIMSEAGVSTASMLIAMTPNGAVNVLVANQAHEVFDVPRLYILRTAVPGHQGPAAIMHHLHALSLFSDQVLLAEWDHQVQSSEVDVVELRAGEVTRAQEIWLPLAVERDGRHVPFHATLDAAPHERLTGLRLRRETHTP